MSREQPRARKPKTQWHKKPSPSVQPMIPLGGSFGLDWARLISTGPAHGSVVSWQVRVQEKRGLVEEQFDYLESNIDSHITALLKTEKKQKWVHRNPNKGEICTYSVQETLSSTSLSSKHNSLPQ